MQITDAMLRAAANIFCEAGLPIHLPQDGDLDDVERERYETLRAALSAALAAAWRPIEEAPKDGTRILIWFVHANAAYSKDPVGEGWEAVHEACWIDHNGGGWTWHGLCGVATKWMPLPSPPKNSARSSAGSEQKRQVAGSNPAERASSSPQKKEG